MNLSYPTALVVGVDHFVAKKLVKEILEREINVVGVGEYVEELVEMKNFSWVGEIGELDGGMSNVRYVFDFWGEEKVWSLAEEKQAKLAVVLVNNSNMVNSLKRGLERWRGINWRIIELNGVYGGGMGEEVWLTVALREAVENKNLELPAAEVKTRWLSVNDGVEAILRASFLSGTEGEEYVIWGREMTSLEIAEVLVDEAKMTRVKVMEKGVEVESEEEGVVEENWRKLRWEPKEEFREGVKEVLQYYFSEADEKSRRKPVVKPVIKIVNRPPVIRPERVVVEEQEEIKEDKVEIKEEVMKVGQKEERIEEIKEIEEEENFRIAEEPVEIERPLNNDRVKKKWVSWLGILVVLAVGVGVAMVLNLGWLSWKAGKWAVIEVPKKIEEKRYEEVRKGNQNYLSKLAMIDKKVDDGGWNRWGWVRRYQSLLKVFEEVMKLEDSLLGLILPAEKMNEAIFEDGQIDWGGEMARMKNGLKEVETRVGLLQARLEGDWSWLPAKFRTEWQKNKMKMAEAKDILNLSEKILRVLPEFLGLDGKKREYMVLFQNEMELRPSGGFIGSYGILSFEDGRLINLDIRDVYETDGQLKGHVEPPEEIRTILGEGGWYMRDANWEADFLAASKQIQWFLEKSSGRKVDGVIATNLAAAKAILGVVGELELVDFKEKINKDNLFEQAEFYAETKFFPGSKQKGSFLAGLGRQLFEEIRRLPSKERWQLYRVMVDLLERNEIQMALNEKKAGGEMANLGWDGSMYSGRCGKERCVADYLYVVEANLGVNKANYFIYRNIEQSIEIKETVVEKKLRIVYENTAKNSNWPGGDYKNYLRIYLPSEINLKEISLVNEANGERKLYTGGEIKMVEVGGKREIGLLVTVPVREKRTLEVKYNLPISLSGGDKFSYLYYIQRQSGYGDTGMVTLVNFPENWQVLQVEPAANLVAGKLLFNQKFDRDVMMGVEIGK